MHVAQEARAAIFAKEMKGHDGTGAKGSQREEAMRKLSAVGVVKASEAFGTRSKAGTQHADAMSASKQARFAAEDVPSLPFTCTRAW